MRLIVLAALATLGAAEAVAGVALSCEAEPSIQACAIALTGRIVEEDYLIIQERLKLVQGEIGATVTLDSEGGDLEAAIRIGRLLSDYGRFKYVHTIVPAGASCLSACPFVYAAGHMRQNYGDIGLHRPFPTDRDAAVLGLEEFAMAARQAKAKAQDYLGLFGVSPCLMEAAMTVPSDRIWLLSADDLQRYGLGPENVVVREFQKSRAVSKCGLPRYQLGRQWESRILAQCGGADGCVEDISADMRRSSGFDYRAFVNDCLR